jgi:hypothetical protein
MQKPHTQCVDVAIHKITSAQDDRLETDVCFASSDMAATDRREVLRESSVGVFLILVSSRVLVPQLH